MCVLPERGVRHLPVYLIDIVLLVAKLGLQVFDLTEGRVQLLLLLQVFLSLHLIGLGHALVKLLDSVLFFLEIDCLILQL